VQPKGTNSMISVVESAITGLPYGMEMNADKTYKKV
jgi:hypothetical protein